MYKTIFKFFYFIIWCHRKNAKPKNVFLFQLSNGNEKSKDNNEEFTQARN